MGRMAKRNRKKPDCFASDCLLFPGQMIKMYLVVVVSSANGAVRRRVDFLFSWLPLLFVEKSFRWAPMGNFSWNQIRLADYRIRPKWKERMGRDFHSIVTYHRQLVWHVVLCQVSLWEIVGAYLRLFDWKDLSLLHARRPHVTFLSLVKILRLNPKFLARPWIASFLTIVRVIHWSFVVYYSHQNDLLI